ncbi:MAG: VWA domain-containing protein [Treponema sp.]|nr:VWA domain-containing protein [Candidatus Treponema equifaecale]
MLIFENPLAFLFALAVPVLYILRKFKLFTRISFPLTISDWNGRTFEWKSPAISVASVFSELLAVAAYLSLVTALASPVLRHQEKIYTSRGTDILFVLDTSPSMAARDISLVNGTLTRIEAAKQGIRTLVNTERGANYGLVAMASEAAALIPPTSNHAIFLERMEGVEIGALGEGSAIGTGLCTAIYHLATSKAPRKCIVLITDGENNAGSVHPETAAALAAENNITLYTFGIGTRGSVPIEYIDPQTGKIHSGFYESEFDTVPLESIALTAGGKYFGIETTAALSDSLSEISRKENTVQTFHYKSVDQECFLTFLTLALILFTGAWIVRRLLLKEIF